MDVFRREGDYWAVVYEGVTARIADTKGMQYLAGLLADPGREFHTLDLVTVQRARGPADVDPDAGLTTRRGGGTGAVLDAQAKAAYRRRMQELREDLDEAEAFGDPERAARARAELEALADHVAAAVGLGGRDRSAADAAERARSSVTKAIRVAIRRIATHHPALGSHLDRSVRTGIYCSYAPDPSKAPAWDMGSARPAPALLPGPSLGTSSTGLVGRGAELRQLSMLLKAALSGRGALVVLAGDPGVGKTRLAAEILGRAASQGAYTALGRCPEAEDSLGLLPFTQILETLAGAMTDPELSAAAGAEAPRLAKVLPGLGRRLPGLSEAQSLPPAAERQVLLDGITTFLVRAAGERGVVLVVDDLQWADEATLACLEHLAQRVAEAPVLVLGTARSAGLEVGRPLARSWERLQRLHVWNHLRLEPLSTPAVADLLEALAGRAPSERLAEAVAAQTGGNPFFVEELYWHLADRGLLVEEQGLVSADAAALDGAVPETVRLVLGHRLAGLGEDARAMLEAAAVIGRSVDYTLLGDVARLGTDALVEAVEGAQQARMVEITTSRDGDCLVFPHDLIRHTLLQGLSLPRRRRLHARVAEALERRVDADEALAADLVHHLLHAQTVEPARVVEALRRAGRQAMGRAAFADAHHHFERALIHSAIEDERVRAELLAERGRAASGIGRLQAALADLQEALEIFEGVHDGEAVNRLVLDISGLLELVGRWHEGAELARRRLGSLGAAPSRLRAQLLALTARLSALAGDFAASDLALDQAAISATVLDDPAAEGAVLHARAYAAFVRFDCGEATDAGLAAARLLGEAGEEWEAASVVALTQVPLLHAGRFVEADDLIERQVPSARRVGHPALDLLTPRHHATVALLRDGDLGAYAAFVEQFLEACRVLGVRWQADAETLSGTVAFWRGNWDTAATHLEEGARLEPAGAFVGRNQAALLRLDAYAGRHDAVRQRWARYRAARVCGPRASLGDRQMAVAGAEAWTAIGQHAEAAALYPQIAGTLAQGTLIAWNDLRLLATAAGVSAAAGGNWQAADRHFTEALHQADTLPHRLDQPEARRLWAQALLHRGGHADVDRARGLLEQALDGYRRLGMPRHAALTESHLGPLRR